MLVQYGFFLWMVLILLRVILWTIWTFSFARSQVSDVVLWILFFFVNVCNFVMFCSKFMLLLLFVSQVSSLCAGLWGFFCCLLWFWPCAWTGLVVLLHFWVCLVTSFAFKILKHYVRLLLLHFWVRLVISFAFKILKNYVRLELKVGWLSKC
jgi:hypothetical protein